MERVQTNRKSHFRWVRGLKESGTLLLNNYRQTDLRRHVYSKSSSDSSSPSYALGLPLQIKHTLFRQFLHKLSGQGIREMFWRCGPRINVFFFCQSITYADYMHSFTVQLINIVTYDNTSLIEFSGMNEFKSKL